VDYDNNKRERQGFASIFWLNGQEITQKLAKRHYLTILSHLIYMTNVIITIFARDAFQACFK
jgi:hypothetical protein